MSWICPYCGFENFQDERVGRREPKCMKCGKERIAACKLEEKLEEDIEDLDNEIDDLEKEISVIELKIEDKTEKKLSLEQLLKLIYYSAPDKTEKAEKDKRQRKLGV